MSIEPEEQGQTAGAGFQRLVDLMRRLRAEDGCAWGQGTDAGCRCDRSSSRKPTKSSTPSTAATPTPCATSWATSCSRRCFLAQISAERGDFDIADSLQAISDKLVRRHPHIFGEQSGDRRSPNAGGGQAAVGGDQGRRTENGRPTGECARLDPRQPAGAAARLSPRQARRHGGVSTGRTPRASRRRSARSSPSWRRRGPAGRQPASRKKSATSCSRSPTWRGISTWIRNRRCGPPTGSFSVRFAALESRLRSTRDRAARRHARRDGGRVGRA